MPQNPFSRPLRIAVVGAGQIGSTFAFQLARKGGCEVTVVARPGSPRLAQLQRDGAVVDVKGERAPVRILDALDEETPYDLVIVTLMAFQLEAVLPGLRRSAAGAIQFMFNMFEPERLRDVVGAERCRFGMPFVQSKLDASGRLKAVIGAGGQKTLMDQPRWVELFNAAGLPAVLEPNMPLWLRCHAPLCVAFESVSVAGERRKGGATWGEARNLARGVHACFALIEDLGFPVYPRSKALMRRAPASGVAAMLWFMSRIPSFRQLLATGERECGALVDTIAEAAAARKRPDLVAAIKNMKP